MLGKKFKCAVTVGSAGTDGDEWEEWTPPASVDVNPINDPFENASYTGGTVVLGKGETLEEAPLTEEQKKCSHVMGQVYVTKTRTVTKPALDEQVWGRMIDYNVCDCGYKVAVGYADEMQKMSPEEVSELNVASLDKLDDHARTFGEKQFDHCFYHDDVSPESITIVHHDAETVEETYEEFAGYKCEKCGAVEVWK